VRAGFLLPPAAPFVGISQSRERARHAPGFVIQPAIDPCEVRRHAEIDVDGAAFVDACVYLANDPDRFARAHGMSIERGAFLASQFAGGLHVSIAIVRHHDVDLRGGTSGEQIPRIFPGCASSVCVVFRGAPLRVVICRR